MQALHITCCFLFAAILGRIFARAVARGISPVTFRLVMDSLITTAVGTTRHAALFLNVTVNKLDAFCKQIPLSHSLDGGFLSDSSVFSLSLC
jgi:hypothetical protein